MTIENLKSKAVKGAGINVIAQFTGLIFHIGGVIVLARLLTPKDFGLVAMVTAFSLWFMNFGENGFAEYIIQKQQIDKDEINSIFWLHVYIASALSLLFAIFGSFLVFFYSEPALWAIAAVMSTSIVLKALSTSQLAMLKRQMQFSQIAVLGLAAIVASTIISILAAAGGMSYWAIVLRQLSLLVVTLVGAWFFCKWHPGYPAHISLSFPGLKYALQVYGNFSINYVMRNIDKVLLGKFHGTEILGNYDRAYHLSMMPVGQLLTPLDNVALATLSRLVGDKERFVSYYMKALALLTFVGTAAALILTISAEDLMLLLLGSAWHDAGRVVMAFGPGIAGMLIYGTHAWLHLSLGTPNRWLRWSVFSSIFTIMAFVMAAPYGGVAMALAYSATIYLLVIPALWYAGQPIGFSVQMVIASLWPYFFSAAIVFLTWLFFSPNLVFMNERFHIYWHLPAKIFFVSIIALLLYISLVSFFQRSFQSLNNVKEFIGIFLGRR